MVFAIRSLGIDDPKRYQHDSTGSRQAERLAALLGNVPLTSDSSPTRKLRHIAETAFTRAPRFYGVASDPISQPFLLPRHSAGRFGRTLDPACEPIIP